MISPQFRPLVGGYERAAERLSTALVARGIGVTVIAERRQRSWPTLEVIDGVVIKRLSCLYSLHLHILTSLIAFAWFLLWEGRRFHVWHVHQHGPHAALAVRMGKLLRRPVVLKLTSSQGGGIGKGVGKLHLSSVQAAALRRADAIVATSRENNKEALAFGIPPGRIEKLANGVDTSHFHPVCPTERLAARADLGIHSAGLVVFVGRLSPEKNPDGVLAAWVKAQPHLPKGWKLVLVGDGPMRPALAERIEAEALGESVQLVGERSDVERWLRAADVYVLASHYEGLSNTTLEAMASGVPVVSTRVSASAETIGESKAGLIVDVGRMDHLADALVRLATDLPLRERMGRAGRAVVEQKYSIDRVAEAHSRLYQRLITPRAPQRKTA